MVIDHFIKNLQNSQEYLFKNIKVIVGIKKEKLTLFRIKKYWISVIIIGNNGIQKNIGDICDFSIEKFLENSYLNNKVSITANWYIFDNDANESIFYGINTKDNIHYKKITNTFALINNTSWELFFNPGNIANRVISDRMKFLYKSYQAELPLDKEKEALYSKEISHLYEVLEVVLKDKKK
jgi:hypothetical protein